MPPARPARADPVRQAQARARREARARLVRAYAVLLAAQLAMSSGGIFGRFALEGTGPLQTAALRLTLASAPLLLRALWLRRGLWGWRLEGQLLAAGGALAVVFAAWTGSLMRLSVGASTLLTCIAPFFNGLYEAVVLRRPRPASFWVALAVAVASVAMMASADRGRPPLAGEAGLGVALALLSSLSMATYYIVVRAFTVAHPHGTLDIITRTYGWAAVLLAALAAALEPAALPALPPAGDWRPWLGIVGLAAVTQGCGHTLQNVALKVLRPSVVSFAALSEPLMAAVMAIVLFQEDLTWQLGIGGGVLLLALGWAMRVTVPPAVPAPAARTPELTAMA